jgi:hypothetical protein
MAKMSLVELFDTSIEEIRHVFNERSGTGSMIWAIARLEDRLSEIMKLEDWMSPENNEKRNYIVDSIKHFQGNVNEICKGENTNVRKRKSEEPRRLFD